MSGCLVGAFKKLHIILLVFDDPVNHAQRKRSFGPRLDRHPLVRFRRNLREAGIDYSNLHFLLHEILHQLSCVMRGAVASFDVGGADSEQELDVARVCLPVKLLAAGELAFDELIAHRIARKVERTLADRRVSVRVRRAERLLDESVDELRPPAFQPPPHERYLIIPRTEVGMIRMDQEMKMLGEFLLEFLDCGFLLLGSLLASNDADFVRHRFGESRVTQSPQIVQSLHVPILFSLHVLEKFSAVDNFSDRLLKWNRHPLVLATLAGTLQHFHDPVGIVQCLNASLTFRTQRAVDGECFAERRGVRQARNERPRTVRIAFDLHCNAVQQFDFDAAAGVALQADGSQHILRFGEFILLSDRKVPCLGSRKQIVRPPELTQQHCASAEEGRTLQEAAPCVRALYQFAG